jgi:hypothetical protein
VKRIVGYKKELDLGAKPCILKKALKAIIRSTSFLLQPHAMQR